MSKIQDLAFFLGVSILPIALGATANHLDKWWAYVVAYLLWMGSSLVYEYYIKEEEDG